MDSPPPPPPTTPPPPPPPPPTPPPGPGLELELELGQQPLSSFANTFSSDTTVYQDPTSLIDPIDPAHIATTLYRLPTEAVLILFSDGSCIDRYWGGCGVAFWKNGHWSGKAIALGGLQGGSREAEAEGIAAALRVAGEMLTPQHKLVDVVTDCKGLADDFKAERPSGGKGRFLEKIYEETASLNSRGVEVKIRWTRAHENDRGNMMADCLAGIGSRRAREGYVGETWDNPHFSDINMGGLRLSKLELRIKLELPTRLAQRVAQKMSPLMGY